MSIYKNHVKGIDQLVLSGGYRFAFFTTEALQQGKNKWLMCLMQSLGKYNLSCYATESQLQEYNSGKFREFMER